MSENKEVRELLDRATAWRRATARVIETARFGGRKFRADEWTTGVYHLAPRGWLRVHSHTTPAED
ncbi:hypothetical protein [Nocardiopsis alborubida]|uniref:Uncharacterized protein n=1 Tax=Nocardiopsis alborubida TaxID=146802 RepID=A0A7X6MC39_9ACTN|nr:hypothetical protein [Nocardiopsis alborubida]NKY98195.1 hypothetical protein [Nocardiopsis alborubida]